MLKIGYALFIALGLTTSAAVGQAPAGGSVRVFDQVCLAEKARQCFDRIAPSTRPIRVVSKPAQPGKATESRNTCEKGYTMSGNMCVRQLSYEIEGVQITSAKMMACEQEARLLQAAACAKTVPIDELVTTLRDDMRRLLADFCKTYSGTTAYEKCEALAAAPVVGGE